MAANRRFSRWRRLPLLFLAVALIALGVISWLGWRVIEQDQAIEAQTIHEGLESAADLAAAALMQTRAEMSEKLTRLPTGGSRAGAGTLTAVIDERSVEVNPGAKLLYYPEVVSPRVETSNLFERGEALEFKTGDSRVAAAAYLKLTKSPDAAIRAEAWMRAARSQRKAGLLDQALASYAELRELGDLRAGGLPAGLVASHSRCQLMELLRRDEELKLEAAALRDNLLAGRWRINRGAYFYYAGEAGRWLGERVAAPAGGVALSEGVAEAATIRARILTGSGQLEGCRSLWIEGQPVLLLWRSSPERLAAVLLGPEDIRELAGRVAQQVARRQRAMIALTDGEGHPVAGSLPASGALRALRSSAETGLPWTLHVASAGETAELAQFARRRWILAGSLALMGIALAGGIALTARAVAREVRLAQLKSDFVSAVSHEFRSPLTTMRQLIEMLSRGRVPSEEKRGTYYAVLSEETDRLRRLVESLLEFGKLEAGAMEFNMETLDGGLFVREVAAEFSHAVEPRGYRVELMGDSSGCMIRADREALSRALWNLLDNAMKYSPECQTVELEAGPRDGQFEISVRDRGIGIAPEEQREIFGQFVRGAAARTAGVRGTGIGLATVDHIVRAHGGLIEVESAPGEGTTMTIVLPAEG